MFKKLILLDFDGVVIDGIEEYWYSSVLACKSYLQSKQISDNINSNMKVPEIFQELRPYVKYGWEMVLITHEILKRNEPLCDNNKREFLTNYKTKCIETLKKNNWSSEKLQTSLDRSRNNQIFTDLEKWIKLHKPFNEVLRFMQKAKGLDLKTGIISTKEEKFTSMILKNINVSTDMIFGYKSGNKIDILRKLTKEYKIICFLEDRKQTLIEIINDSQTSVVPCFLAEWGYLKESDKYNLPTSINLLKLKDLEEILANSI